MSALRKMRCITALMAMAVIATPSAVQAHLLPKGSGTVRIVENSANLVISIPASALEGVNTDGDGQLSIEEISEGQSRIVEQFENGILVTNDSAEGALRLTWVLPPDDHGHAASADYVVVLSRVFFDTSPDIVSIRSELLDAPEGQLTIRATRADDDSITEIAELTADNPEHTFFLQGT